MNSRNGLKAAISLPQPDQGNRPTIASFSAVRTPKNSLPFFPTKQYYCPVRHKNVGEQPEVVLRQCLTRTHRDNGQVPVARAAVSWGTKPGYIGFTQTEIAIWNNMLQC